MLSQNGWTAGERAALNIVTVTVPGTSTRLPVAAGDVADVLLWVATRWHNEVEPLEEPGNWGYAYRPIRGATSGLSNHASGTAIDLNAPKHPLGTEPSATLNKTQVAAAQRIEADSGGVVRWGGSYTGRKDPMHWEINAGPAAVAAFAARIRGGGSPTTSVQEDDMYDQAARNELVERIDQGFARMTNSFNALDIPDTRTRIGLMQYGIDLLLSHLDTETLDYDRLAAALAPVIAPMINEAGAGASASEIADLLAERLKQ